MLCSKEGNIDEDGTHSYILISKVSLIQGYPLREYLSELVCFILYTAKFVIFWVSQPYCNSLASRHSAVLPWLQPVPWRHLESCFDPPHQDWGLPGDEMNQWLQSQPYHCEQLQEEREWHITSLVPRPRPDFCRFQYGKLGGAWEWGYDNQG